MNKDEEIGDTKGNGPPLAAAAVKEEEKNSEEEEDDWLMKVVATRAAGQLYEGEALMPAFATGVCGPAASVARAADLADLDGGAGKEGASVSKPAARAGEGVARVPDRAGMEKNEKHRARVGIGVPCVERRARALAAKGGDEEAPSTNLTRSPAPEARPGAVRIRGLSFRGMDDVSGLVEDEEVDSVSEEPEEWDAATDTQSLPGFLVEDDDSEPEENSRAAEDAHPEATVMAVATEETHPEAVMGVAKVSQKKHRFLGASLAAILIMIVVIVLMGLGLGGVLEKGDGDGQEKVVMHSSTLARIQERGYLKCSYTDGAPFEKALCQVMAAGIMGDESRMEYVRLETAERFVGLEDERADIVLRVAPHTMESSVLEPTTMESFTFSRPYLYTGIIIAGRPFFVNCTEDNMNHLGECLDLRVCFNPSGTIYQTMSKYLPRRHLVRWTNGASELISALNNGTCNTVAMGKLLMDERSARFLGLKGEWVYGTRYYTKGPHAIVTSRQDNFFSNMVNAVFDSLVVAEENNITQETAWDLLPPTSLFGEDYNDIFRNAVGLYGNYGEIYNTFVADGFSRDLNHLNDGTTGLIYSHPFGFTSSNGRGGKPLDESLQKILNDGVVRCGVRPNRKGFATAEEDSDAGFEGIESDYCRALAAALFGGDQTAVEFVSVDSQEGSFQLLEEGSVDVVMGATRTFQNGVREKTTGRAFEFSQPYFYSEEEDNLCLATIQTTDRDWSSLVWWVVSASFYAEEQGITTQTSIEMPEVFLYGEGFKRIFRDSVFAVGSYGEMYERHLEPVVPRQGRNLLNSIDNFGPQQYALPGFWDA